MAFRTDEPVPHINYPGVANTIVEGHAGVQQDAAYWRERRQADVLASGDVTSFAARRRLRQAGPQGRRRVGGPARRRRQPDLREPLRLRAGRRLRRQVLHQHRAGVHRALRRPAAAVRALRPAQAGARRGLRPRGLHARAVGEPQRVPRLQRGAAARRARRRLDRRLARGARSRRQLRELRRGRRLRDVGGRGTPLPARPRDGQHQRLLDGRRRDVPARLTLAGPVRARVPDRRAADVGGVVPLAAQRAGARLVRADRRARRPGDERGGVPERPAGGHPLRPLDRSRRPPTSRSATTTSSLPPRRSSARTPSTATRRTSRTSSTRRRIPRRCRRPITRTGCPG